MDEWIDGYKNGYMDKRMDGWKDETMDRWIIKSSDC